MSHLKSKYVWSYKEGLIMILFIITFGLFLDRFSQFDFTSFSSATIAFLYILYIIILFSIHYFFGKSSFILWYTETPIAVITLTFLLLLLLLMGILPQNNKTVDQYTILNFIFHIETSKVFLLAWFNLFSQLGLLIIKNANFSDKKNWGSFLNHFGIWILCTAFLAGSPDRKHFTLNLIKNGDADNIGLSESNEAIKLPFSVRLIDFRIDLCKPKLSLLKQTDFRNVYQITKDHPSIDRTTSCIIGDWYIKVSSYLSQAFYFDSIFKDTVMEGSYPAAYVIAVNCNTLTKIKGWISSGSFLQSSKMLTLGNNIYLKLEYPDIQQYRSNIEIYKEGIVFDTLYISANHPVSHNGWVFYQVGYDQSKGKWSKLSIIEVTRDPFLPLIGIGCISMVIGIILLALNGQITLKKSN